jgi:hypothetical protein
MARSRTQNAPQDAEDSPPVAPRKRFDLATRRMAEEITLTLVDPIDAKVELDAHITIRSPRSKEARAAAERKPLTLVDGKVEMTDDSFADAMVEQCIAVTAGWDLEEDGAPLACTEDNVRRVYTDPATAWVQGQVQNRYWKVADFFEKRATS